MKNFKIIAIGLMLILCVLFIYIAEDIPKFGDPEAPSIKYVELFSIIIDKEMDLLYQNKIPNKLVKNLSKKGFPPPVRIEKIQKATDQWNGFAKKDEHYYDREEKYYFFKKEGDVLKIYRYAFVVRWIEKGLKETAVKNMVTYGLADYRGYDTLGETSVIFTAGISVVLLLRRRGRL